MKINRKRNAISGTVTGVGRNFIQIAFSFLVRTIFIKTIGIEYLGLNSLFTAVLQVLNLAELGVSSALVFSMYKPIVDDDEEKICKIMNLYRFYYFLIGVVVLGLGLCFAPVLPRLIEGDLPSGVNLYVLYFMNLGTTVLSYWLFAYRNSLFLAFQRNDVINIIHIFSNLCTYIFQIFSLIWFKNYYLYLAANIGGQVLDSVVVAIASKKIYPNLRPNGNLPISERKAINRKVKDLFIAKLGAVVNNSADSLVISALLGLHLLAVYQNYYYVISALMAIFNIFFSACTAGIGNSLIIEGEKENRNLFYNINYIVFVAINYCSVCLVCLYQPFIELWVGKEHMLPFGFVILFAIYLYAEEAPRTVITFKDAGGIWEKDRFRPLVSASVNVFLNLLLTSKIGLYGIIISTIIALMCVSFPWGVYNINKYMFKIDVKKYLRRIVAYTCVIVINTCLMYVVCSCLVFENLWLVLIARLIICTIGANVLFICWFRKFDETKYLVNNLKRIINIVKRNV